MKNLFGVFAIFLLTVSTSLSAQEATSRAAAIAEQQDAADRYQRLSALIEDLQASNVALQRRVGELENNLQKTRAEILAEVSKMESRIEGGSSKLVSQDQLKKVIESVNDVDKKRAEEDKKIVEAMKQSFEKLKAIASTPALAPAAPTSTKRESASSKEKDKDKDLTPAPSGPMKGFEHSVAKGEYLTSIIKAYNEALKEKGVTKKITQDMVMKANPDLNPNKMVIGQKIFIPDPTQN